MPLRKGVSRPTDRFVCEDCGWRGLSVSINFDEDLASICGGCEGTNVVNLLSEHLDEIQSIYDKHGTDWVSRTSISEAFSAPYDRFNNAINYALIHDQVYIQFDGDDTMLYLTESFASGD